MRVISTFLCVLVLVVGVVRSLPYRIISGRDAKEGEFPYQVSLEYRYFYGEGTLRLCGGAIIDERHIITAAHCTYGRFVSHMLVVAGVVDLSDENNPKRATLNVSEVYEHEDYDNEWFINDIAILRVDGHFPLSHPSIDSVPMQSNHLVPPANCMVTGWGYTDKELDPYPEVLQALELPLLDADLCEELYELYGGLNPGMMCAGYIEGGRDACDGDSGGPLVCNGVLTGLVSWGNKCALPDYPGVYSEVAFYRSWIESTLDRSMEEAGLLAWRNPGRRMPRVHKV